MDNGQPTNGVYDFQFRLFDLEIGGVHVGSTIIKSDIPVSQGLFTIPDVDFGSGRFNGEARWLEISVRPGGSTGSFTPLVPLQPITATPNALYSLTSGALQGNPVANIAPTTGQALVWNDIQWAPTTLQYIPTGAVLFFNLSSCPPGWTEYVIGRGRYLVGSPAGGAQGSTVGTPLANLENRSVGSHNHPITDPGHTHSKTDPGHNHAIFDPGHSHSIDLDNNLGSGGIDDAGESSAGITNTASNTTGIGISSSSSGITINSSATNILVNNEGSVWGTNAPYVQLLICRKD
jgi:hypothetical protein